MRLFYKDEEKDLLPTKDAAPILVEISAKNITTTILVLFMLGTDELILFINLLSVELDILEELVHTIEAIGDRRDLHYI